MKNTITYDCHSKICKGGNNILKPFGTLWTFRNPSRQVKRSVTISNEIVYTSYLTSYLTTKDFFRKNSKLDVIIAYYPVFPSKQRSC